VQQQAKNKKDRKNKKEEKTEEMPLADRPLTSDKKEARCAIVARSPFSQPWRCARCRSPSRCPCCQSPLPAQQQAKNKKKDRMNKEREREGDGRCAIVNHCSCFLITVPVVVMRHCQSPLLPWWRCTWNERRAASCCIVNHRCALRSITMRCCDAPSCVVDHSCRFFSLLRSITPRCRFFLRCRLPLLILVVIAIEDNTVAASSCIVERRLATRKKEAPPLSPNS
jgi:hypothetical protein